MSDVFAKHGDKALKAFGDGCDVASITLEELYQAFTARMLGDHAMALSFAAVLRETLGGAVRVTCHPDGSFLLEKA